MKFHEWTTEKENELQILQRKLADLKAEKEKSDAGLQDKILHFLKREVYGSSPPQALEKIVRDPMFLEWCNDYRRRFVR